MKAAFRIATHVQTDAWIQQWRIHRMPRIHGQAFRVAIATLLRHCGGAGRVTGSGRPHTPEGRGDSQEPPAYLDVTGGPKLWTIKIVVIVAPARPLLSAACPAGESVLHRQTDGDLTRSAAGAFLFARAKVRRCCAGAIVHPFTLLP